MTFSPRTAPHAVATLVTPAVAIVASTIATATVLETGAPHWLVSGDTVEIVGHLGATPAVDGSHLVTVIDATHVSIPLAVTVAGAGGTLTRTIAAEPLTLDEGKLRAGLAWMPGDPRDALLLGFLAAARRKVQQDTGVVPLLQLFDVALDALPREATPIALPWRPVSAVLSVTTIDRAGVGHVLDPTTYALDPSSDAPRPARLGLAAAGTWPTDLRAFQPITIRMVAGYASLAALTAAAPWFLQAMGLLTAHYATLGRDLASIDPASAIPQGYADTISDYVPVAVA